MPATSRRETTICKKDTKIGVSYANSMIGNIWGMRNLDLPTRRPIHYYFVLSNGVTIEVTEETYESKRVGDVYSYRDTREVDAVNSRFEQNLIIFVVLFFIIVLAVYLLTR